MAECTVSFIWETCLGQGKYMNVINTKFTLYAVMFDGWILPPSKILDKRNEPV